MRIRFTERSREEYSFFEGRRVAKTDRIDGLKLMFEDGPWVLFRLSGTGPVSRLYCEADRMGLGGDGCDGAEALVWLKVRTLREATTRQGLKRVWLPTGCAAVILSLVLLGLAGDNGYLERRSQRRQIQALTEQIENLRQENLQLGQTIKSLRSDPAAIEELARERLRLGRPGEVIITLPKEPPNPPPAPDASP